MPTTVQEFVAQATLKSAEDLLALAAKLPEEKRYWRPDDKGRSAADQLAECALMNKESATLIKTHEWPSSDWDEWGKAKDALAADWGSLIAALRENTQVVTAAIRAVPDGDLDREITLPWETASMSHIINYCFWNMSYHEGQITYISTLLE